MLTDAELAVLSNGAQDVAQRLLSNGPMKLFLIILIVGASRLRLR